MNGLLFVDAGGAESLAASIRRALTDRPFRATMSANALRSVTERITLGNMVDGFEAAIRRAADRVRSTISVPATNGDVMSSPILLGGPRPQVAVIANAQAPYRLHLHRRLAREIPEMKLWSVFTHGESTAPWRLVAPDEIGAVYFGNADAVAAQSDPLWAVHEWKKGGRIIDWMRDNDIRMVVLQGYNDMGRLRILRWCRKHNIPCLVWGDSNIRDDDLVSGSKRMLKHALLPSILRTSSGVLACGSAGAAYFERYGVTRDRIHYFTLEPDYSLVQDLPARRVVEVRERFSLDPRRRRIVYSGRLIPLKRVDLLIDAFAAIAEQRPEWDLVIVGDGPLREPLEQLIPAGPRERVVWTGFLGEQADISAIYRASDVLVLPSEREPWALVINEAAAAGLAIVSSNVPGASAELVRDGVNGRIFPSGDAKALAECLLDVTREPRLTEMRAASLLVLDDWRCRADPVDSLRQLLGRFGLIAPPATPRPAKTAGSIAAAADR